VRNVDLEDKRAKVGGVAPVSFVPGEGRMASEIAGGKIRKQVRIATGSEPPQFPAGKY
jgi:hypothetical protein